MWKMTKMCIRDRSLDAEPDAGDVQDACAPMRDVLFYQLAHRLGVACGQRTLGFAQHTDVYKRQGLHQHGYHHRHAELDEQRVDVHGTHDVFPLTGGRG